jgi:hypothetical protein
MTIRPNAVIAAFGFLVVVVEQSALLFQIVGIN